VSALFGFDYRFATWWRKLRTPDPVRALEVVIGDHVEVVGRIERDLLVDDLDLPEDGFLVDVGCGIGRLAAQLKHLPDLRYLGVDVVKDLLAEARRRTQRPDWRFERLAAPVLPAPDASADMVCAFSVFTHVGEPVITAYLREAWRVLKPGGTLVFTFLDPAVPDHQRHLRPSSLRHWLAAQVAPRNVGFSDTTVRGWALAGGYTIDRIESPHPQLQSLAVFRKPL
jgi:ubiquinone/menaquinone biosynthesis C-methylase UbiE